MTARWAWAAARCRGTIHVDSGTPVQDAFVCFTPATAGEVVVAVVSDGAGSAAYAAAGACLVCRIISQRARRHFAGQSRLPDEKALDSWVLAAHEKLVHVAADRGREARDFAATLVMVVSNGQETLTVHVGDGAAVARGPEGSWRILSWPENGDYASMTYFVTDESTQHVRIQRHAGEISALAVMSDGLERLALDLNAQQPHAPFFNGMLAPVEAHGRPGRNRELSRRLAAFLDSEQVNNRTLDDKTLILATRR